MNINGGRLSFDAYIKDSDFQRQIQAMEQRIIGMSNTADKQANRMDQTFANLAKSAAAFLTLNQAQNFVQQLIKVRSEFQQLEIAFTTMLGSKERADRLTQELIEFASTTPFGMSDAANAAKQLLAYGSAAESVTDELRMLGDVAAGTSQPIGDLVYLYGTLRTQGRAYTQDIRQFAGRGIPIYRELATVLGVAEDQVNNLVSSGKVGFAEIEQAFRNMTAAGSMFGGLMEAQSKTIQGELERLGDAIEQMYNDIGKESEGVIGASIQGLAALVENYRTVLDILAGLIITYGAYRAAVLATTAAQSIALATTKGWTLATTLQYRALLLAEGAQKLLNRTMLANPYVAITTAVVGLTFVMYKLVNNLNAAESAQKRVNDLIHESNLSVADQTVKLNDLLRVAQDETKSKLDREKAMRDINRISPEYLGNLSLETINTKDATTAIDAYIAALRKRAFEEAAYNERVAIERERMNVSANGAGNAVQRAGMWLYGLTGGDRKAMQDAAKQDANDALDAREKALDEELKKRSASTTSSEDDGVIVTTLQRLTDLNRQIQETEQNLKDALSPDTPYDRANIESLRDSLENLRKERDLIMGKSKEGETANRELQQWGDKKIDILHGIAERETEIRNTQLSDDDQELERVRTFYRDLRQTIEDHNKRAPASQQIGAGTLNIIDGMEARDLGNTEFEQFNRWVLGQINSLSSLEEKIVSVADQIRAIELVPDDQRTEAQVYALKEWVRLSQELNAAKLLDDQQALNELLEKYANFESRRKKIIEDTEKEIAKLRRDGRESEANEASRRLENELTELHQEEIQSTEAYREMERRLNRSGSMMAMSALKHGRDAVMSMVKGIKDATQRAKLETIFGDWFDEAIESVEQENFGNVVQLVEGFDRLVQSAQEFDGTLSTAFNTIGSMVTQVGRLAKTLGDTMGELGGNMSKSGGIMAIVGAFFSLFGSISNAIEASYSKRAQKEQEARDREIHQLNTVTKILEYQLQVVQDIYGTGRVNAYVDVIAKANRDVSSALAGMGDAYLMQDGNSAQESHLKAFRESFNGSLDELDKAIREAEKKNNIFHKLNPFKGWGTDWDVTERVLKHIRDAVVNADEYRFAWKSIADITQEEVTNIRELIERGAFDEVMAAQLENIIAQWELWRDAMNQLNQELTGTTFQSITDEIVGMFREGKVAAEDFANSFEKLMQNAVLQSFKRKYLEEALQGWYDEFAGATESGGGLDEGEIAALQQGYNTIIENARKGLEDMQKVTGTNIGSDSSQQGSLSKGIAGITETTANRLEAEFGGLRLAQLQLLEVSKSQSGQLQQQVTIMNNKLAVLNSINTNTGRTADNTERLANIETAIVSLNNKISNTDSLMRGAGLR